MIDFVPQLDEAKLHFEIECKQNFQIEADIHVIVRLIQNVISNSIRVWEIRKENYHSNCTEKPNVEIKIKNYGQCISKEDLPYIF